MCFICFSDTSTSWGNVKIKVQGLYPPWKAGYFSQLDFLCPADKIWRKTELEDGQVKTPDDNGKALGPSHTSEMEPCKVSNYSGGNVFSA